MELRRQIILDSIDQLDPGQSIKLINDHVSEPLRRLIDREKKGMYLWKVLKDGPDLWEIKITKKRIEDYSLSELVKIFPASAHLFESKGIDYFVNSGRNIVEVCERIRCDRDQLWDEIQIISKSPNAYARFHTWNSAFVIDYILENHHTYVADKLPQISLLIKYLDDVHGSAAPYLTHLKNEFLVFQEDLEAHIKEEEEIVFPELRRYIKGEAKDEDVQNSLIWMEEDHILTGSSTRKIRSICNNYIPGEDDLPGVILLYKDLKEFEADLHFHIYLENNVLFTSIQKSKKN